MTKLPLGLFGPAGYTLAMDHANSRHGYSLLAAGVFFLGSGLAGTEALPFPALDPEQAALYERFGGSFVSVEELPTHYYDFGERESEKVAVFIHGICATGLEAAELAAPLTKAGYRVIAPDWPGAGLSWMLPAYSMEALRDWLEGFRAALGIERFVLLGHSFGGYLSAEYAARYGDRVERLILIDPAGFKESLGFLISTFVDSAPAVDAVAALYEPWYYPIAKALRGFKDVSKAPKELHEFAAQSLATEVGRKGIREIALRIVGESPDIGCLGELRMPVLLFWAVEDRILPYSFHRRFLRELPVGAAFRPVEGCGHSPHLERPEETAQDILAFLARDY